MKKLGPALKKTYSIYQAFTKLNSRQRLFEVQPRSFSRFKALRLYIDLKHIHKVRNWDVSITTEDDTVLCIIQLFIAPIESSPEVKN